MLNVDHIKITPRDQQVLQLLIQACSNKEIRSPAQYQPTYSKTAPADPVPAGQDPGWRKRVKLATAIFAREMENKSNHATP